ncbi:MAG: hypothetical protein GY799_26360 [Desulfobulbaceae bacterium]|nr:hypothetical protein [Desulfobulbaceae bacterium]
MPPGKNSYCRELAMKLPTVKTTAFLAVCVNWLVERSRFAAEKPNVVST